MQALRVFCAVAELRSFSEAAVRRGITQSAVSQRVRLLEQRLGAELLDRSVRPFVLTPAGELLAREGREIIARYDDLAQRVAQLEPELEGKVLVDAIYSAGIGQLSSLKARFEEQAPGVSVVIEYRRPEAVAEAVRGLNCDFGIISYPKRWRDVKVRPLSDERMCVVCSPDHSLATRGEVEAAELDQWPMVGFDPGLPVGRDIRRYLRTHGVKPEFAHVVDNIDTIKTLLRETDQIAILPQRTVLREVEIGTLEVIELSPPLARPMGLIQPRHTQLKPSAQAFADFLQSHSAALNPLELDVQTEEALATAS